MTQVDLSMAYSEPGTASRSQQEVGWDSRGERECEASARDPFPSGKDPQNPHRASTPDVISYPHHHLCFHWLLLPSPRRRSLSNWHWYRKSSELNPQEWPWSLWWGQVSSLTVFGGNQEFISWPFFSIHNTKMFVTPRSFGQKKKNLNLDTLEEIIRLSGKTLRKSA